MPEPWRIADRTAQQCELSICQVPGEMPTGQTFNAMDSICQKMEKPEGHAHQEQVTKATPTLNDRANRPPASRFDGAHVDR